MAYAWSVMRKKVNEWGKVEEVANPGDEVSQGDFEGMTDEEWKHLEEQGVVREAPYPKGALEAGESPERYRTNLLAKMGEGEALTEEEAEDMKNLAVSVPVSPPVMEGDPEGVPPGEAEEAPAPAPKANAKTTTADAPASS
jgi:nucleoid-associated protein YgaU